MACPFFFPLRRLQPGEDGIAPRLPLLAYFSGQCHAGSEAPAQPDDLRLCNTGYARARCPRFPQASPYDAVRISLRHHSPEALTLRYVLEKDCWPAAHGQTRLILETRCLDPEPESRLLARQLRAFAEAQGAFSETR